MEKGKRRQWITMDPTAKPGIRGTVVTNITELIKNSDKINMMRLLGCEEKYTDGSASDFEFFAEWERVAPLCAGTGVANLYREERKILGLSEGLSLAEQWKVGNETLRGRGEALCEFLQMERVCFSRQDLCQFLLKNTINKQNAACEYQELRERWIGELISEDDKRNHIFADFRSLPYCRPDPYHASLAWREEEKGECEEKEKANGRAVLLLQLLIDGILALKKKNKKIILHLSATDPRTVSSVVTYLSEHGLMTGQIRLRIGLDGDLPALTALCERSTGELRVLPELVFRASDFDAALEDRLLALFSRYPVGGMRFGGIETDAPLLAVAHDLLEETFERCLIRLSVEEYQRERIAKVFFGEE